MVLNICERNVFDHKVKDFLVENHLCMMWNKVSVDYTYIHTDKESSSTIDHFPVNEAIINLCTIDGVNHIYSDGIFHSPAFIHLDIGSMSVYIQDRNNFIPKVAWYKASRCDIDTYKYNLQHELQNLTVLKLIYKLHLVSHAF